jgi:hypothetical protein
MQQNEIYNIPLPRGPGPKTKHKKKGNESGINYPGELKTLNSSPVLAILSVDESIGPFA